MKKFLIGLLAIAAVVVSSTKVVKAWTCIFNYNGKQYEMSRTLTGKKIYPSVKALRKLTDSEMRIQMTLYREVGANWNQVGSAFSCPIRQGTGTLNEGCYATRNGVNSGSAHYYANWKQTTSGETSATIDITNYIPS